MASISTSLPAPAAALAMLISVGAFGPTSTEKSDHRHRYPPALNPKSSMTGTGDAVALAECDIHPRITRSSFGDFSCAGYEPPGVGRHRDVFERSFC
jgi:hypothetical protein